MTYDQHQADLLRGKLSEANADKVYWKERYEETANELAQAQGILPKPSLRTVDHNKRAFVLLEALYALTVGKGYDPTGQVREAIDMLHSEVVTIISGVQHV